jgi:hypothetical protein
MTVPHRADIELANPAGQAAEEIDPTQLRRIGFSGCLATLGWAVVAGLLLFINGGLMLALVHRFGADSGAWLRDERVTQVLVLIGPVVLLVMQWWLVDRLRAYLPFRR